MLEKVLTRYGLHSNNIIQPFGSGLINTTWKILNNDNEYILQKINQEVFQNPYKISENIEALADYLANHYPQYYFVRPLKTLTGHSLVHLPDQGFFRLFPFIKNSITYNVTQAPEQAFEAAFQFGRFTKTLDQFPVENLKITLPGFHNLTARYDQFMYACSKGNASRIKEAESIIQFIRQNQHIVDIYKDITSSASFQSRVTHHDTKISNILFDTKGKGICVIDLDTVMPGYFISDAGDMIRTYVSPVSEEEKDFSAIEIRDSYFQAIVEGYLTAMGGALSEDEIRHFVYAGKFMIYMQAVRFLTDHLNNDRYYGAAYEGHNYTRAGNQVTLLKHLLQKEKQLNEMVLNISGINRKIVAP